MSKLEVVKVGAGANVIRKQEAIWRSRLCHRPGVHLPPFNLGFESRKSKPRPAAGRCVSATSVEEMGELGLVARLRKRLTLGRKVKAENTKSNGITTKTLPRRSEGNSRTNMK